MLEDNKAQLSKMAFYKTKRAFKANMKGTVQKFLSDFIRVAFDPKLSRKKKDTKKIFLSCHDHKVKHET